MRSLGLLLVVTSVPSSAQVRTAVVRYNSKANEPFHNKLDNPTRYTTFREDEQNVYEKSSLNPNDTQTEDLEWFRNNSLNLKIEKHSNCDAFSF